MQDQKPRVIVPVLPVVMEDQLGASCWRRRPANSTPGTLIGFHPGFFPGPGGLSLGAAGAQELAARAGLRASWGEELAWGWWLGAWSWRPGPGGFEAGGLVLGPGGWVLARSLVSSPLP